MATFLVMDPGVAALVRAGQASKEPCVVRVYDANDVQVAHFQAPSDMTLSMLYSLVGRAIKMQGFSMLHKDRSVVTHVERDMDVIVDAFGPLGDKYALGRF